MNTPTQDSYARLKDYLATWPGRSGSQQPDDAAYARFRLIAQTALLPELRKLAAILQAHGLDCEVFAGDEDTIEVGIRVESCQAVLRLSPAHHPVSIRALVAGGRRPNDYLEWLIPYHLIANGGLERELQAVILRLLKTAHPASPTEPSRLNDLAVGRSGD